MVGETAPELKKMGIQVVSLVIQDVNDQHGYIDALGKRAVAEAVRDAEIKVAQAKSQSAQQVSTAEARSGHRPGGKRRGRGRGRKGPGR